MTYFRNGDWQNPPIYKATLIKIISDDVLKHAQANANGLTQKITSAANLTATMHAWAHQHNAQNIQKYAHSLLMSDTTQKALRIAENAANNFADMTQAAALSYTSGRTLGNFDELAWIAGGAVGTVQSGLHLSPSATFALSVVGYPNNLSDIPQQGFADFLANGISSGFHFPFLNGSVNNVIQTGKLAHTLTGIH